MLNARSGRTESGEIQYQTLREHSLAVAEMTGKTCAGIGLGAAGELCGKLHDGGKSPPEWQAYLVKGTHDKTVEHSLPGASFLMEQFASDNSPGGGAIRQMLALAVHGHHGGLHDVLRPDGESGIPDYALHKIDAETQNRFFTEVASAEELRKLFAEASAEEVKLDKKLRVAAKNASRENDKVCYLNAYQAYRGLSERFLYAALMDADRYDAARWEDVRPLGDWKRERPDWGDMAARLRKSVDALPAEGRIPQLRQKIACQCRDFRTEEHGVYRAFVPTGGGKTLSVMALALNAAETYGKDHIFFLEPFLTILEQNAGDVREKCGAGDAVFEHHSNVLFEDDKDGEKLTAYQKRSERWDAPVIFTSLVQMLDALYAGRTAAARRMCALANSVLVIDEVQAVPLNSQYLFNLGMSFLADVCGCIVVLCTATPPALENLSYPLRFQRDVVPDTAALYKAFRRTEIDTSMAEDRPREPEEIAAFLAEKQAAEGSVLAIMNTKSLAGKLCAAVRERVPDSVPVYYLSTYLCAAHRKEKLDEIRALLAAGKPVICVTTQLIEAGVDVSFRCVVRALAGMDSILQAAGRCNRHGGDERKTVYVVKCAGEDRALAYLPEIQIGQQTSEKLFREVRQGLYGGDLQSPAAIAAYYRYYFGEGKNELKMAYIMDLPGYGDGFTAVDLLGINGKAREEYRRTSGIKLPPDQLAQSFKTAENAYHPISQDAVGVLVPWKGGAELIARLRTEKNSKTRANLLRQTQRYSVNLFRYELRGLLDVGVIRPDPLIDGYVLDDSRYSEEYGVIFDEYGSVEKHMC